MAKVTKNHNLKIRFPEISEEWCSSKNGDLKPEDVTPGSNKKVWWKCPKGGDHEWEATISNRTIGQGCPFCSGKRVSKGNNLEIKFPEIAKQWHPTKNGNFKPKDTTPYSHRKAWWLCEKGHVWDTRVSHRTNSNSGCPFCTGQKTDENNSLKVKFPEISKQWHPIKNGDLKPEDVLVKSGKRVWWQCDKGHEWETRVEKRTRGTGCPFCDNKTSKPEMRIYAELKTIFDVVMHRHKIDNIELDIFLPDLKLGIEYDGSYFHKDRLQNDVEKNSKLLKLGVKVFRIRAHPLQKINKSDIVVKDDNLTKKTLNIIVENILSIGLLEPTKKINEYLIRSQFADEDYFNLLLSYFPNPLPSRSLQEIFPEISKQWHPAKNNNLQPNNFSYASDMKVWWKCSKGSDHEWEATIANRTNRNSGCPFCAGQRADENNNIKTQFPKISKQWHPIKNGDLKPENVTRGSGKKVWWQCKMGHEWSRTVKDSISQSSRCPICKKLKKK
jgi:hypothetical protein